MKAAVVLTVAVLSAVPAAWAAPRMADHSQGNCIAMGAGLSRVAAVVTDCCGGRMQCSQYLSTMVVVRPQRLVRS